MPIHKARRLRRAPVGPADPNQVRRYSGQQPNSGDTLDPNETPPIAPEGMRYIGFCRDCRDFVELGTDFSCLKAGHSRDRIAVALLASEDEPLPHMPALNVGALFMPALWGPVHGQWYMILFYPLWLLLDNLIYGAVHGNGMGVLAGIAAALTAAFTIYYALHANSWGYIRAAGDRTPSEYLKVERRWAVVFVLIAVLFLVFATWFNLFVRPGMSA